MAATTAASSTVASRGIASDFTATYHGSGSQLPRPAGVLDGRLHRVGVVGRVGGGDQAAGGGEDPCGFGQSGRRVGEVVDRERGDHGVERAVAEGEDDRVTGRGRWPTGRVVPQHPDGDVDGDGGSSAGRLGRPARGSGTGAEIEHGSAGDAARAVVDEHLAQLVVDPARTGLPGPAGRGVGVGEGPPVAQQERHALAGPVDPPGQLVVVAERLLPTELHDGAQQAEADLALPPARRVDAVAFERGPEVVDGRLLGVPHGEPGPVEGQVPGQLVGDGALAGVGPVEEDHAAVAAVAEVALLPVAVEERLRRVEQGHRQGPGIGPELVDPHGGTSAGTRDAKRSQPSVADAGTSSG